MGGHVVVGSAVEIFLPEPSVRAVAFSSFGLLVVRVWVLRGGRAASWWVNFGRPLSGGLWRLLELEYGGHVGPGGFRAASGWAPFRGRPDAGPLGEALSSVASVLDDGLSVVTVSRPAPGEPMTPAEVAALSLLGDPFFGVALDVMSS